MAPLSETTLMAPWLEQAWLGRYLERELTGEETAWFEAYLLDKPALLDQLALDLRLRDECNLAGQRLGVASPPNDAAASRQGAVDVRLGSTRSRSRRGALAIAASLAASFGLGILIDALPSRNSGNEPIVTSPVRIVIDASRGGVSEPHVENAGSKSDLILIDALVPVDAKSVVIHGVGITSLELPVSQDGVASAILRRSELRKISPLSLRIRTGQREFEKSLSLDSIAPGETQ